MYINQGFTEKELAKRKIAILGKGTYTKWNRKTRNIMKN